MEQPLFPEFKNEGVIKYIGTKEEFWMVTKNMVIQIFISLS